MDFDERVGVIDVIIPTYERPELTARAVASVVAQTLEDWRLILSDDGSSESTRQALHDLVATHPRITLVESAENGGPQAARQRGLDHADAPLIAFLDSDDLWLPDKLRLQVDALGSHDIVLCWHRWMRDGKQVKPVHQLRGPGILSPLLTCSLSSPLIRHEVIKDVGGMMTSSTRNLRYGEDVEFYIRLAGLSYAVVPEVLVERIDHEGQRASGNNTSGDRALVVNLHRDHLRKHWPRELATITAGAAWGFIREGQIRSGLSWFRQAIGVAPSMAQRYSILRQYGPAVMKQLVTTHMP